MNAVKIIKKACVGCATCAILAPGLFSLTRERKSEVIRQPAGGSDERRFAEAVNGCPVNAISVDGLR